MINKADNEYKTNIDDWLVNLLNRNLSDKRQVLKLALNSAASFNKISKIDIWVTIENKTNKKFILHYSMKEPIKAICLWLNKKKCII